VKLLSRLIFLTFMFLIQVPVIAQGKWEKIDVATTRTLNSVFFTDSLYGWITGDSGTIIHTADGGKTWSFQNSGTNNNVVSVFFLNRNLGWASSQNYTTVPYGTLLLETTNGGTDWTGVPYPVEDIFITCILFRDSLNGWMGGRPHALVRTTDGGTTWNEAKIDSSVLAFFPVLNIRFYNDKYGYACGGMFDIAGVIWSTSNGGESWHAIDPSYAPADEVHELHLFDSLHVIGAGGDPDFGYGVGMIRTSDGGESWNYQELGMQGNAYDIDFRNGKEVWAPLGPGQKLIFSMDTGRTWTAIPTPGSTAITQMTFPDSLHGFAVGRYGAVIKYKPPALGIPEPVTSEIEGIVLSQNYPNPFNEATKIKFRLNIPGKVSPVPIKIKVYSASGTEVSVPVDDRYCSGEYEVMLDGANLPCGLYYYRLFAEITGSKLSTAPKKMVVIR
jgi:photosystem II stability/assembly factor-like uncharacterized protein